MWLWTRKVSGINFDGTWTRYVCNNVIISILWLASATTRSPSLVFLIPYDFYMQNLLCFASLVINRSLNECWSQGAFVFPSYYKASGFFWWVTHAKVIVNIHMLKLSLICREFLRIRNILEIVKCCFGVGNGNRQRYRSVRECQTQYV